jgi:hypothetical protein
MGVIEALLFTNIYANKLWKTTFGFDVHIFFTVFRVFVFAPGSILIYLQSGLLPSALYSVAVLLMFSFFHNGFYYLGRKKLDGAYNGFTDTSRNTTAKNSFNFKKRTVLLIISILILYYI